MAYKKLIKTPEQLLLENTELKKELARVHEELENVRKGTGISELKQRQQRLQAKLRNRTNEIKDINRSLRNDIIEFKRTKDALEESGKLLSSVYNSMSDGMAVHEIIYDESGKAVDYAILDVNPSYEKITGLFKSDITGKRATQVYSVDNAPYLDFYSEVVDSGIAKSFETYFPPMQKYFHVSVSSPGEGKFATVFQDITARRQSEDILKNTLERFYLMLSSMYAGILLMTDDGAVEFVNEAFCNIYGLSEKPTELVGLKSHEFLEKIKHAYEDPEAAANRIREILSAGKPVKGEEFSMKEGKTALRDFIPITIHGKSLGRLWIHIDITERKQTENALKLSEDRFRTIAETVPVLVCVTRIKDSIVLFTNELNNKTFGLAGEDIIGTKGPDYYCDPSDREKMLDIFKKNGLVDNFRLKVKKGDGTPFWIITSVRPIVYHGEQALIGASIDITEYKKVEDALRESEEKFLSLFNLSPLPMALSTIDDGVFSDVNKSFLLNSGFTQNEIIGKTSAELNLFLNSDTREQILFEVHNKGAIKGLPCEFRLKSGKILNCLLSSSSISIKGVPHLISAIQDITDIIETREALKESERRFRALAENIPDMIVRFDKELRILYGNPAVIERTGLPLEYLQGKTSEEYSAPDDSNRSWEKMARQVLISGKPSRIEYTNHWQGKTKVFDSVLVPEKDDTGQVTSVVAIARDITDRKRSETILRNSEQRLKYHLENSPLAVVEWDRDFKILQWSNEAERLFGRKKEEVLGVRIDLLNIIYKEDYSKVEKTIERLVSGKELKIITQNRNITNTGEILECIWYNSVLLDENGEMSSVLSLVEDITLLRRTERELSESRESYKELVTNARSIILKMDTAGRCIFINEFALEFFGFTLKEMLGVPVMDTIVPKRESTGRDLRKMADNIIEDPDRFSVNINENIKKNGELVWVEWHNKALYDENGIKTGHIGIGIDITQKKKAEEALLESEHKLRSVLDATKESIYMFDNQGILCMANSTGLSRLKQKSENDIIGHHLSDFLNPKLTKQRQEMLYKVFRTGTPLEFEDEWNYRIYHHNFFPVFKDDRVLFVVSYSTDITRRKFAESALLESENRFRTIAESLPVMISIVRMKDEIISFVNEPFIKSFGYSRDELIGQKTPDIFCSLIDRNNLAEQLKETGVVNSREVKVKRSDGKTFWIITFIRIINFMNEPSFLVSSIDITETKRSQEDLLRLNRTLNANSKSSQAMMHSKDEFSYLNTVCKIIIDDCGYSMVWIGYAENDNHKSVRPVAYYGFDQGYIDQMNITWDDTPRGRGPTGTAIRTGNYSLCRNMLTDPAFEPWRTAAIERGYASSLVLPLKSDGRAFGAISIYSKEPDQFSESEIELLTELADDLSYGISFIRLTEAEREATRIVKESESKLKDLVATKDKFFNIVAHDLKNPFTSLLGSSELLYDNISQMSTENVRKLALILNDSAKGGYAILQNLLDWSRSETGLLKFNPERLNLKMIIDENIENLQLQVTNKEISLTSDLKEDLFILSDKNMLNTVLRNLMSNAVKYTYKNGKILVSASQGQKEIVISVKDSGIGIQKSKVDTLFRIDNSISLPGTEKEQGTGLGLKLCKEFSERMGGRIWVESEVGHGSEFKFTIPVQDQGNGQRADIR